MREIKIKLHSGIDVSSANPFDCVRVHVKKVNAQIPKYQGIEADKKNLAHDWGNVGDDIRKSIIRFSNERTVKQ